MQQIQTLRSVSSLSLLTLTKARAVNASCFIQEGCGMGGEKVYPHVEHVCKGLRCTLGGRGIVEVVGMDVSRV
jgi:hypothetical protein